MLPDTEVLVALSVHLLNGQEHTSLCSLSTQYCSFCFLLLSWPHRNEFHNGVKGKKVLFVPCRTFYYIVLDYIKRWEKKRWVYFFSSVNCRSAMVGYFSSPGLVEDLALMVLVPPVHKTCRFYWRGAEHSDQTHFYCGCIQVCTQRTYIVMRTQSDSCTLQHMQGRQKSP